MDLRLPLLVSLLAVCLSLAKADSGPFVVSNGTTNCILARLSGSFIILYPLSNGSKLNATLTTSDLTQNPEGSYCYDERTETQAIKLSWGFNQKSKPFNVTVQFSQDTSGDGGVVVSGVALDYDLTNKAVFPNADVTKPIHHASAQYVEGMNVSKDSYFKCDSGVQVFLFFPPIVANLTMLKLQAFRMDNSTNFMGKMDQCSGDGEVTTVRTTEATTERTTTETTREPNTTMTTMETTREPNTTVTTMETTREPNTTATTMMPTTNSTMMPTTEAANTTMVSPTKPPPPTQTPTVPSTTPSPDAIAQYSVKNDTTVCILANMGGMFAIDYKNKTGNNTLTTMLYVPDKKTTSVDESRSYCFAGTTSTTQAISLTWSNGTTTPKYSNYNLTIRFDTVDNKVVVNKVSLEYDLRDTNIFPDADVSMKPQRTAETTGIVDVLNVTKGYHLKCDSGEKFNLMDNSNNLTLKANLQYVKLDAFRSSNTSTFDDAESVCSGDTNPVGTYNVTDSSGKSCLLAQFDMNFDVVFFNHSGKETNKTFTSYNNGTVDETRSVCNFNNTAVLAIKDFLPMWILEMHFTRKDDKYTMNKVFLEYSTPSTVFPDANNTAWLNSTTNNLDIWGAHLNKSYKCSEDPTLKLNVTGSTAVSAINFRLDKVHVQAFMEDGTWNDAEVCSSDNGGGDTSEIVPIAVGCALAALVIIVLIAYVIGRRRNRARGYESM